MRNCLAEATKNFLGRRSLPWQRRRLPRPPGVRIAPARWWARSWWWAAASPASRRPWTWPIPAITSTWQLDAIKSEVTAACDGCALCLDVCPYRAIKLEEYGDNGHARRRIVTDKALCKGCGLCEATCPKEGVTVHGFTQDQLKAQVDAVLEALG